MTEQRKTLLAIVAMLLVANAVALAVINHKPTPTPNVWFGGHRPRPSLYPDEPFRSQPVYTLTNEGVTLKGSIVPTTTVVSNIGRRAYQDYQDMCEDWCLSSPWAALTQPDANTSIGAVLEAARQVRAQCNVEFVVFPSATSETGATIVFESRSDRLGGLEVYPDVIDVDLMHHRFRDGETLEQFGERTGCAQVSPLRP